MLQWSTRQKANGVRLALTWFDARQCWKKKIDGKVSYFKTPNSALGYEAALQQLAVLTGEDQRTRAIEQRQELIAVASVEEAHIWKVEVAELLDGAEPTTGGQLGINVNPLRHLPETTRVIWQERLANRVVGKGVSVGSEIDRFLLLKQDQAKAGTRSLATWDDLRKDLGLFLEFTGRSTPVEKINATMLTQYYSHLLRRPNCGGTRKSNIFRSFKQWLRWLNRNCESFTMPKNLNSPDWEFERAKKPEAALLFTVPEIASLRTSLPKAWNWEAIILLTLNCGFTQMDLSSLRWLQIQGDRLIHQRIKTKRRNTPIVNYKLWPETIKALGAPGKANDLVFMTENGTPLVSDNIKTVDGTDKRSKWDNLSKRWYVYQTQEKPKVPLKPFKYLRKTAATTLRRTGGELAAQRHLFLGHVPGNMADQYYSFTDVAHPGQITRPGPFFKTSRPVRRRTDTEKARRGA